MNRRILSIVAAAGLLIGTSAAAYSQSNPSNAPGQRMQDRGSAPGQPGASGYAPGREMQEKGNRTREPGASGFAPGHQDETTGRGSMGNRDPEKERNELGRDGTR